MPKISVRTLKDIPVADASTHNPECRGPVEARPMIVHDDAAIHLRHFSLKGGGSLTWNKPTADICAYVLDGAVEINGITVEKAGAFFVEHDAQVSVSSAGGADIAVFEDRFPQRKSGGKVHAIRPENVPNNADQDHGDDGTSWLILDSTCKTCDLWLQQNYMPEGNSVDLHSHSQDEIIFTTSGEIILGERRFGPFTAISIAKDTVYSFRSGKDGFGMINFRPAESMTQRGDVVTDGSQFFRSRFPSPTHEYV
jgi:quercetin dioxygenase-like cupin family protein